MEQKGKGPGDGGLVNDGLCERAGIKRQKPLSTPPTGGQLPEQPEKTPASKGGVSYTIK